MLCLSGFEVYSRWVPLMFACLLHLERVEPSIIQGQEPIKGSCQ